MADLSLGSAWGLIDPTLQTFILVIAIPLGLILVFAGKLLWKPFMSILGGFIGAVLGFALGLFFGGTIVGLIGAIIGGFIGSFLFAIVVEFALAVLAGIISLVLIDLWTGSLLLALIVGAIAFIGTLIFVESVIGIITAIAGALIVGLALMGLGVATEIAAILALVLMVVGSIVQSVFFRKGAQRKAAEQVCPRCQGQEVYDSSTGRWVCPNCPPTIQAPPAP